MLEARIGIGPAREQALRDAIPQYLAKAVREHDVDLIATPEVEITGGEEEGPVEFDATCEIRPEITVPGYGGLRVELPSPAATDEEIDEAVQAQLRRHGSLDRRRPARSPPATIVTLDLAATRDGEEVAGAQHRGLVVRGRPGLGHRRLRRPAHRRLGRRRADVHRHAEGHRGAGRLRRHRHRRAGARAARAHRRVGRARTSASSRPSRSGAASIARAHQASASSTRPASSSSGRSPRRSPGWSRSSRPSRWSERPAAPRPGHRAPAPGPGHRPRAVAGGHRAGPETSSSRL